jgi:dimethylargininase
MSDTNTGFGVSSSVAPLRKVAMRRPGAMLTADHERWHYTKPLDPSALTQQYEVFAELVAASGAEIVWVPDVDAAGAVDDLADSVFTYDPSFAVPGGAVVLRPGKSLRAGEADLHATFYDDIGVPVLGRIEVPGVFEGGDCFWLDATTLAAGRGFRTNQSGIEQMAAIVAPLGISVEAYDLPYHLGPDACLHLMSVVSVLDDDLALVHPPLMPTALYQRMADMGYTLLEAPAGEFDSSLGQ